MSADKLNTVLEIRNKLITKFWPLSIIFLVTYIPMSFFILNDRLAGWLQLSSLVAIIGILLYHRKTKNVSAAGSALAFVGIPVILPWLLTGGPSGAGLWWSAVYVIWVFFITTIRAGLFWLTIYLLSAIVVVVCAHQNIVQIAYSDFELINILFSCVISYLLVFFIGQVITFYSNSTDIELTNRKNVEEKIKKINEELEKKIEEYTRVNKQLIDFCNIVSHNLRAPLVNISMLTDFIENAKNESERKELIEKMKPIVLHFNEIFNELVESLQIRQDTEIELDKIELEDCTKKVLHAFEGQIKLYDAKIEMDYSAAPIIYYPQKYIDSILTNLISNALKYKSPDRNPHIILKTTANVDNNSVILSVADNSLGIDLDFHRNKIFKIRQVFHKHPDAKGFGLFITKSQVDAMGGKIWVESTPDVGSTFFIEFLNV